MIVDKIRKLSVIANDHNMLFFLMNLGIATGNVRLEECYAVVFEEGWSGG
jgi:hypothetical protein